MPTDKELGAQRFPGEASARPRPCPYCGAVAMRDVEEGPGDGILGETVCVCAACGRSISKPTWARASTRRALLFAVRTLGPVVVFAVAAWLLAPVLTRFPLLPAGPT